MSSTPIPTPPWPAPLLRLLEGALNRVLALDPDADAALEPLEGRSIALRLKPWPSPVQLSVRSGRLSASDAQAPDLSIALTPGTALALLAERGGFDLPAGRIDIAGDAELARRVRKLIGKLDPDWDAPLARVFGEVLGQQIGQGLRRAFAFGRETAASLLRSSGEYLREESRDLVAPAEIEAFVDAVDTLRDDAERLQLRFQRLQQRRATHGA